MRWLKVALLAAAAVVLTQAFVRRPVQRGAGTPAPALSLPDVRGTPHDLAALRGKVVAVNFWATWCVPCLAEMPELADVWRRYRDRCFELLGVAEESDRADVERMAETLPYPILLDERAKVATDWKVPGYPFTFLVDAHGKVARVFQGSVSAHDLEASLAPLLPASCAGGKG
jgi:cytochrome c biogenesis protein CcmG/thiol:disulfide interchange protein DsbE